MEEPRIEAFNNKKCYSCGKDFRTPSDLLKHKNRKTPCLIREIAPEQRANPNRCIFCNKIFSNVGNLNKHLQTCKIKNGGMDILDEKVRYEQEIRILRERDHEKDEKIREMAARMEAQMKEMQAQIDRITANQTTQQPVNNINNTVNIGTMNITFNNYDKPFTDSLAITQDDLLVENIARKMIELIYFNKDIPANHTIYLPNIKEKRLLMYRNNTWETVAGGAIPDALVPVKNNAYRIGSEKVNSIYATDEDFERLYPVVKDSIQSFNRGGPHAQCSDDEIIDLIRSRRDLVAQTLRTARIL